MWMLLWQVQPSWMWLQTMNHARQQQSSKAAQHLYKNCTAVQILFYSWSQLLVIIIIIKKVYLIIVMFSAYFGGLLVGVLFIYPRDKEDAAGFKKWYPDLLLCEQLDFQMSNSISSSAVFQPAAVLYSVQKLALCCLEHCKKRKQVIR